MQIETSDFGRGSWLYMGNRVTTFTRSDPIGGGAIGPILGKSGGPIPIVPIPIAHV